MSSSRNPGSKPEKTMSSRLLTMKFMQRAAAATAAKEISQSPPVEDAGSHNPKRPRHSTEAESESPRSAAELEAISAAVAAEEGKRKEAIARQAAEAGETEWVLDYSAFDQCASQPNVVAAGSLDADDDVISGGRRSYGNFKRKKAGNKATDVTDPSAIDSMIEKEKQKETKPVKLSRLTSISGGRQSFGGEDSQRKRKHK